MPRTITGSEDSVTIKILPSLSLCQIRGTQIIILVNKIIFVYYKVINAKDGCLEG